MGHHQIVKVGESAALLLSHDLLAQLNIHIGDNVDVAVIDHTLVLRSLVEAERQQQLDTVIDTVFTRRQSAYQQLAQ